jgi:hypothetical protein
MPAISTSEATERLAEAVEKAPTGHLPEIYDEIFPTKPLPETGCPTASDLASHIRAGFDPEEIVDLWRVMFPADRNIYYDEEEEVVRYNDSEARYADR